MQRSRKYKPFIIYLLSMQISGLNIVNSSKYHWAKIIFSLTKFHQRWENKIDLCSSNLLIFLRVNWSCPVLHSKRNPMILASVICPRQQRVSELSPGGLSCTWNDLEPHKYHQTFSIDPLPAARTAGNFVNAHLKNSFSLRDFSRVAITSVKRGYFSYWSIYEINKIAALLKMRSNN